MEGKEKRNAVFRTIIGFYDGEPKIFKGECKGRIAKESKGTQGFGYDPIFVPHEDERTFGEMEIHEKNLYSHRGKALKGFVRYLKER
jgi:XTP/dITP diphosphohydrolase